MGLTPSFCVSVWSLHGDWSRTASLTAFITHYSCTSLFSLPSELLSFSRVFSCTFVPSAAAFTNPLDSDPFHWGLWSFCSTSARLFHGNVLRQTQKRKTALRPFTRHDSRSLRGDPPGFPGDQTRNFKKKKQSKKKTCFSP